MNRIVKTIVERPGTILLSFCFLIISAVLITGSLSFEQDIFKILPQQNLTFKVLIHALRTSDAQNKLYLLVRGPANKQELIDAGNKLSEALRSISIDNKPALAQATFLKMEAIGNQDFKELLTLYLKQPESFLTEQDLPHLRSLLTSQDALEREFKRSLSLIATPGTTKLSSIVAMDPLNFRQFLIEKLQTLFQGLSFAPGPYLISPDGHALLIIATPAVAVQNPTAAKELLSAINNLRTSSPNLKIGITGGYAVEAQQEALIKGDILNCIIGSIIPIAALFLLVYRNLIVLVFIVVPLAVGLQLALGVMALIWGQIHILALAFASVVLGLGIDFTIHVYDRYVLERQLGKHVAQAIELSLFRTGPAILACGTTTIASFIVLIFTGNLLIRQIGWLVSLGLLFCLFTTLWALPAWMVWLEKYSPGWFKRPISQIGMARIGQWTANHPIAVLILSFLVLGISSPGLFKIKFEKDLLALRPKGLEALDAQQDLLKAFGAGAEYAMVVWSAKDVQAFWEKGHAVDMALAKYKQNGTVISWTSLAQFTSQRPLLIGGIDQNAIEALFKKYGLQLKDFKYVNLFLNTVAHQNKHAQAVVENNNSKQVQLSICKGLDNLPGILSRFFICGQDSIEGITWVRIPGEKEALLLRDEWSKLFPDSIVVNQRLAVNELVGEVRSQFWAALGLSIVLNLAILILFYRQTSAVLYVLVPLTMGLAATAGIMGWFGVDINLFNYIVLPILIGAGVDYGIVIFCRFQESGDIKQTVTHTGRSVLLTVLTTVFGFGSLSLANYHVLEGMGLMVTFGILACFFFSITALPAILQLIGFSYNKPFKNTDRCD